MKWVKLALQILNLIFLDPRTAEVRKVVAEAEAFGVRGERKRSWALNTLVAKFPDAKVKDLAFLIERVMQEV
jgi:hypothetical protein